MDFKIYSNRVNQKLDAYLSNQHKLTELMRYSVLNGGKRFRSTLAYTAAKAFSTQLSYCDSSACAVELIHSYSLIHDDLPAMDDDDIRHNQPSCHKKFGQAQAILAGDALQTLAFDVLANDPNLAAETKIILLQLLTKASLEMAYGQSIDVDAVNQNIGLDVLADMHTKKTGALLRCAIKLGALCGRKCGDKDIKILDTFAESIGLAYQIQDDVLDVLTPEETLGKRQNADVAKNKPTYPTLIGLDASKKTYIDLYAKAQDSICLLSVDAEELSLLTSKLLKRQF